jgi:hypothetical protein
MTLEPLWRTFDGMHCALEREFRLVQLSRVSGANRHLLTFAIEETATQHSIKNFVFATLLCDFALCIGRLRRCLPTRCLVHATGLGTWLIPMVNITTTELDIYPYYLDFLQLSTLLAPLLGTP